MKMYEPVMYKQLELLEGGSKLKSQPAKRVNIVSLKMVKESSLLYQGRYRPITRIGVDMLNEQHRSKEMAKQRIFKGALCLAFSFVRD